MHLLIWFKLKCILIPNIYIQEDTNCKTNKSSTPHDKLHSSTTQQFLKWSPTFVVGMGCFQGVNWLKSSRFIFLTQLPPSPCCRAVSLNSPLLISRACWQLFYLYLAEQSTWPLPLPPTSLQSAGATVTHPLLIQSSETRSRSLSSALMVAVAFIISCKCLQRTTLKAVIFFL